MSIAHSGNLKLGPNSVMANDARTPIHDARRACGTAPITATATATTVHTAGIVATACRSASFRTGLARDSSTAVEIAPQSWSYLGSRGNVRLVNSDSSVVKKRPPGRPAGEGANRDAILDAAKRLFADRGYDGASMRAIAAQAGVESGVDSALLR